MKTESIYFFEPGQVPCPEERAAYTDPSSPLCPFHRYVGNRKAVRRLCRAAEAAWQNPTHRCSDQNFAILGPASTGKTTLVKMFASAVRLPFVEVHPKSISNIQGLLAKVLEVLNVWEIETAEGVLQLQVVPEGKTIVLPECVIFIDEVHSLGRNIVQALLKATEPKDNMLDTGDYVVDCSRVCWAIATTDRGMLFDAFDTRFTKIYLQGYGVNEIGAIVKLNFPDWEPAVCRLVARYGGRIPREVLAFAREMVLESTNTGSKDWAAIAKTVASDNDLDENGMTLQRRQVLKTLSRGAVSKQRLCDIVGVKVEELEKYIMPGLMISSPDQEALVSVTSKGYVLTTAGMALGHRAAA